MPSTATLCISIKYQVTHVVRT